MTYLFKLARRISRLWPGIVLALPGISGCTRGDKVDFLGPNPNPIAPSVQTIRVEPQLAAVQFGTEIQFTVAGYTASGTPMGVTVDWLATGGSMLPDGRFRGDATGSFQVTARVRGHESIADSARVSVWQTGTEIVQVIVFPDSANIEVGDTLQADAVLLLADGALAPNAMVTWTANGGSIDGQGRFTASAIGTYVLTAQAMNGLRGTATVLVGQNVRILRSITVSPSVSDLLPGQSTAFISTAGWSDGSSGPADVIWSATGGTISPNGVYTAGSSGGIYLVEARHRLGTLADTARISITLGSVAELSITPGSVALQPGATQLFSALARLTDNTWRAWPVTWQATSGTIDASGLYTAGTALGTFKVIASAVGAAIADTVSVTVTLTPATLVDLHLNPSNATVPAGQSRQFSATADWSDGTHSLPPLTWRETGGTISANGLYTAGSALGSYAVVATGPGGVADTSIVTIVAPVLTRLVLAPGSWSLLVGQTVQFTLSGVLSNGSPSVPSVSWSVSGGTMSSGGLFTAGTNLGTYAIVAIEQGGTLADTSYVTITLPAPVLTSLVLTPASAALAPGGSKEFGVIGTWSDGSTGTPAVTWSATGGTISSSNKRYTAGSLPGTYRVIAREAGGTRADTSSVVITSPVTLTGLMISPKPATVGLGATRQFSASAMWSNGTTTVPPLTWTATGGTVSGSGLYTAGTTSGTYRVIARHQAGTKADTASVTVSTSPLPPPTLTGLSIAPKPATMAPGAAAQFAATATWSDGSSTLPALTWSATGGTISGSGRYTAGSTPGGYRVIATGGGKADTSAVTITSASAPTLTAVVVTPGSASLVTGGVRQFTAAGQYSDGSTGAVAVTWSGTGGVVTAAGLYTGGMSLGTYRVIATQQGGTKADTAVVTLSVTPPPSALYPNQPGGMTFINERAFDAKVENGWGDRGDANFSIVQDPTAPRSASSVGQAKYPVGFPSGSGPIQTAMVAAPNLRTLYASYWIKISSNWLGNASGGNKVIFFHTAGTPTARVYSALRGSPTGDMSVEIDFQNMGTVDNTDPHHAISWNGHANQNVASAILPRGVWKKWEVVLVMNTPGQYDGEAHWWLDGVKVGQYTQIGFSGPTETGLAWRKVDWNPTYGGAGPAIAADQFMWMDHIYVSGK